MTKAQLIYLCVFLFLPSFSFSQNPAIDSLIQVLDTMPANKQKVQVLISISRELYAGKEAKSFVHKAIDLATEIRDDEMLSISYNHLAWVFSVENNADSFQVYSDKAEKKLKANKNYKGLAKLYNSRAIVFYNFGQADIANKSFEKAWEYDQKAQDPSSMITTLNNWGIFYFMSGDYQESIKKLDEGLKIYKEYGMSQLYEISRLEANKGNNLWALGQYKAALEYYKKAYLKRRQTNIPVGIGASQQQFLQLWLELVDSNQDTLFFTETLQELGYQNTTVLLDSLEQLGARTNNPGIIKMHHDISVKVYEAAGNYKLALDYFRQQEALKDSLMLNEQNIKAVADIKIKYDNEVLQNEVLRAQIARTKSINQRNTLIFILIAILLLSGLSLLYVRQRLKAQRISLQFETQKLEDLKKQQQIISMNSMLEGQEKERTRIAKDLHDGLGNLLAMTRYQIASLSLDLGQQFHRIQGKAENMIDEACSEVRKIAHDMMPRALNQLGLAKALQDLCEKQDTLHQYQVFFQSFGKEVRLAESIDIMLYRVAQEVFNNINKHADANEVILQLTYNEDWLNLTFEDDGKGFNSDEAILKGGLGLQNIQSRVTYLKGECLIDSRLDEGTSISINIPIAS